MLTLSIFQSFNLFLLYNFLPCIINNFYSII